MSTSAGDDARAVRLVPHPDDTRLADDLETRLGSLESAARRVRRAADPEAVHDLRVASRRLTAALALWSPRLPGRAAVRARRRVRRLRRALRGARDLEVARAEIAERLPHLEPATRVAVEALAARLDRRLAAENRRARARVTGGRLARIRRAVERAIARRDLTPLELSALQTMARTHVESQRRVGLQSLATAARHDVPPAWHRARLDIKRWRYAAECTRSLLAGAEGAEPERAPLLDALKAAQEALGRVQDLVVLTGFARARLHRAAAQARHAETAALARFLETLAAEQRAAMAAAYRLATTLSAGEAAGA
ncbi:MAG: CHAD domain-containing protein [Candidatus Eisenbacteria bacterium]